MDFAVGNSDHPLRLLIIDGAQARAERLTTLLREFGYTLQAARLGRAREALTALQEHPWDLVLIETDFASKNTTIAFSKLARHKYDAPLLSYSESQHDTTAIQLTLENGARDFLCLNEPKRVQQILQRELGDLNTRRTQHHYEQLFIEQLQHHTEKKQQAINTPTDHGETNAEETITTTARNPVPVADTSANPIIDKATLKLKLVPAPKPGLEAAPELKSEPASELELELELEATPELELEPAPELELELEAEAEPKSEPTPELKLELEPKSAPSLPDKIQEIAETSLLAQQHDPLTGLYSPAYFLGTLKQSLSNSKENSMGLLHMEIDNLDLLRAQSSPEIVQLLLAETAGLLCQLKNENYVAAHCDDASFTLLLNDKTEDEIVTAAKDLRKLIHAHDFSHLDPGLKSVNCSIGLCLNKKHSAADAERLMSQAHHACNIAMQAGGNKICAYAKKTRTTTDHTPDIWPARIKQALKNNRFNLVFQPIITINGTTEEYYELFLRMLDDDNNEILPSKFLLAAEENYMLADIDRWVVKNSIAKLTENHAARGHSNFFIKITAKSIRDQDFLPWLIQQLRHTKGISSNLTFEINEADLVRYPDETRVFIHLLKEMHCHTALEHFGTLPQSLQLLKDINIEYIKLDHSLIHDLSKNPGNATRIKDIITTAHQRGIKVIAVAVQDAQILSTLWHYNIDYIQGYFLQKPDHELCFDFSQHML